MSRKILVDESIFVLADRDTGKLHSRLIMFLQQSQKADSKRNYCLYITTTSKRRLGMYRWYDIRCFIKGFISGGPIQTAIEKRRARMRIAKKSVVGIKRKSINDFFFHKKLMDIFMHVNEAKSKNIEKEQGRRIVPEEIIPLEVCIIAQIAHRKKMPILSFNTDYNFFSQLPIFSDPYITYLYPESFLTYDVQPS